ncbi:MAG: hypothetical protein UW02_C0031G0012, partial [Candidatus Nomurabacteria bacterium GW2011_GWB1_43_7]
MPKKSLQYRCMKKINLIALILTLSLFYFFPFSAHAYTDVLYSWAKSIGGTESDYGYYLTADGSGNTFTTGNFYGTVDFDPSASTANLEGNGNDMFVLKLDSSGNYVWAKGIGGSGSPTSESIALDNAGNIYTAGRFSAAADFDPGAGTANLTSAGGNDVFVAKYDSSGNYVWAKNMGGSSVSGDFAKHMTADGDGNVYTTGYFYGTADFDPGAGTANLTSAGNTDIFVSKLDSSGNYVWAGRIGGTGYENGIYAIYFDSSSNVYVTGNFSGTIDFDPGAGTA